MKTTKLGVNNEFAIKYIEKNHDGKISEKLLETFDSLKATRGLACGSNESASAKWSPIECLNSRNKRLKTINSESGLSLEKGQIDSPIASTEEQSIDSSQGFFSDFLKEIDEVKRKDTVREFDSFDWLSVETSPFYRKGYDPKTLQKIGMLRDSIKSVLRETNIKIRLPNLDPKKNRQSFVKKKNAPSNFNRVSTLEKIGELRKKISDLVNVLDDADSELD